MERPEHYTRRINIEKLLSNGVIQEDIKNFQDSYAKQEFFQAIDVLKKIIWENDFFWQENGGYLGTYGSKKATGKREEIFNVIPFLGARGTGKTSTMLSFANMLAEFDPDDRKYDAFLLERDERSRRRHEDTKFIVLQYIDVGVLKSKEDIMAIILARMLKYVQKKLDSQPLGIGTPGVRQEELRQLYQNFEQVYTDLLNLTQEGQEPEEELTLRRLQNLNSSYSLADKFQSLVYQFLDFLNHIDHNGGRCRYYLIIALDDIDLFETTNRAQVHKLGRIQQKDAYTISGQIYEYLQIPGVVVLTTYDESRLLSVCSRHVEETFPDLGKQECMSQAVQFIHKFILPKYKIYMPNLGYADYPENRRLNVVIGSDKSMMQVLFPDLASKPLEEVKGTEIPMKELILRYIAAIYGTYFDMNGTKQHFFEEWNLRKVKNLLLALRMEDETSFEDAGTDLREQRYMRLLSYLYNQFVGEKLAGTKEFTLLHKWLNMPLERRSLEIFNYIRAERSRLSRDDPFYFHADGSERAYNYGELIRNLYISSRCGILSKEMVYCILASYSLVLARLYDIYRSSTDLNKKSSSEYALRDVLRTSIAGQWSNDILYTYFWFENPGKVVISESPKVAIRPTIGAQIGSVRTERLPKVFRVKIDDIDIFSVLFNKKLLEDIEEYKKLNDTKKVKELEQRVEKQKEGFKRFLNILELLGMFFTNVCDTKRDSQREAKTLKYRFKISEQDVGDKLKKNTTKIPLDGQGVIQLKNTYLEASYQCACFNILNFVVNSFTWKEYFNALHGGLRKAVYDWGEKSGYSTVDSKWNEWIQECSLSDEFLSWSNNCGDCAIPFQHFDMTYNILKRQGDVTDHGLPERAHVSDFYKCCQQVYQNIDNALAKQDQKYMEKFKFAKAFNENPFIKTFRKFEDNDEFTTALKELAEALIREASTLRGDDDILGDYPI